jgi:hypothetical protein
MKIIVLLMLIGMIVGFAHAPSRRTAKPAVPQPDPVPAEA